MAWDKATLALHGQYVCDPLVEALPFFKWPHHCHGLGIDIKAQECDEMCELGFPFVSVNTQWPICLQIVTKKTMYAAKMKAVTVVVIHEQMLALLVFSTKLG